MFEPNKVRVALLALFTATAGCTGPQERLTGVEKDGHSEAEAAEDPDSNSRQPLVAVTEHNILNQGSGIKSLLPFEPGSQGAGGPGLKKPITKEDAARILGAITSEREQLQKRIDSLEAQLEKPREDSRRITAKYGTIGSPKLELAPDYQYVPVSDSSFPFTNPERNGVYRKHVAELYEAVQLINSDLEMLKILSTSPLPKDLLSGLSNFRGKHQHIQDSYVLNPKGQVLTLRTDQDVFRLMYRVAGIEFKSREASISSFDRFEMYRILAELKERDSTLFDIVDDVAELKAAFDPILRQLYKGYPESFPRWIMHPNQAALLAATGDPGKHQHTFAFHREMTDTFEFFPAPRWIHMIKGPHEMGHAGIRIGFIEHEQELERGATLQRRYCQFAEKLDAAGLVFEHLAKEGVTPTAREHALGRALLLDMSIARTDLTLDETKESFDFKRCLSPSGPKLLEEAGAWEFQKVFLAEFARKHPEIGPMLMQLAEFDNRSMTAAPHDVAFTFAEQLARDEHAGDVAAAYRGLCALRDAETIEILRRQILTLNGRQSSSRSNPLHGLLPDVGAAEVRERISEETERRMELWEESGDDSKHCAEITARIQSDAKRAKVAFEGLLRHLYSN
ncbi:hypothetical protein OAO01_01535 [Oligoflexia bacterium]|nr:hypothetical protein [Oligoflexia bacterium]